METESLQEALRRGIPPPLCPASGDRALLPAEPPLRCWRVFLPVTPAPWPRPASRTLNKAALHQAPCGCLQKGLWGEGITEAAQMPQPGGHREGLKGQCEPRAACRSWKAPPAGLQAPPVVSAGRANTPALQ